MEELIIEATTHTPAVEFYPGGKLKMEGRSFPEDVMGFYDPLIEYAENLECAEVIMTVNMDYFNTASSRKMLDLLRTLDANTKTGKVQINWYYEADDEDSIEIAEIFEEALERCEFLYHECAEVE